MLLPLLEIVLAGIIANVVADVIATFVLIGRCCANCCTINTFVAEGIIVPVADVIATIDLNLGDVIIKWQME